MKFESILIRGAFIIGCLAILWVLLGALLQERVPNALTPRNGYLFDYVVVGAGSAGSVVASLLAKHSNCTVLLIEAGEQFGFLSKIPLLTTFQQKGLNDWNFQTVPQLHSSRGLLQQRQSLPRGKGLGGSSQLNFMLHFDGNEADFNRWADNHNLTDWRWDAVRPFLEAERAKLHDMFEIPRIYSKLTEAFVQAAGEFEHKPWTFRRARYNIKKGLRYSNLQRFLKPALKHRNLRIITNALAKSIKLSINKNGVRRVKSLEYSIKDEQSREERTYTVGIDHELIVSAGAYQTPQLLLASGIGDAQILQELHIPLQLHLPQVGRNLHDHINFPLFVSIDVVGPTLNQRALLDPISFLNYLSSGSGHLGNFGVLAHIYATDFSLTLFGAGAIDESALMSISNFKRANFRALFPRYYNATQEGFMLITACLQPQSRGTVTIAGSNLRRNPIIDPNYLSEQSDMNCTIRGVRAAVDVVMSQAFADLRPRIHWPKMRDCSEFGPFEGDFKTNRPSDRYLECVIRQVGLGSHHPGGTCAMGTSHKNSVVDAQFRMHGVKNLRIVDGSVLPTPISGNPNSVISAMAIRAATIMIKEDFLTEQTNFH